MSWLYDDASLMLGHEPNNAKAPTHPANDFEHFHDTIVPIDESTADIPIVIDQGIKNIRVRNLQWWTNEKTLRTKIGQCGTIQTVEFESSLKNGKSLGIANIQFETSDAALRAIEFMDNLEIDGKNANASLLVLEDVKMRIGQSPMPPSSNLYRPPLIGSGRRPMSPRRNRSPHNPTPREMDDNRRREAEKRELDDHRRREAEKRAIDEHKRREAEKRDMEEHRRREAEKRDSEDRRRREADKRREKETKAVDIRDDKNTGSRDKSARSREKDHVAPGSRKPSPSHDRISTRGPDHDSRNNLSRAHDDSMPHHRDIDRHRSSRDQKYASSSREGPTKTSSRSNQDLEIQRLDGADPSQGRHSSRHRSSHPRHSDRHISHPESDRSRRSSPQRPARDDHQFDVTSRSRTQGRSPIRSNRGDEPVSSDKSRRSSHRSPTRSRRGDEHVSSDKSAHSNHRYPTRSHRGDEHVSSDKNRHSSHRSPSRSHPGDGHASSDKSRPSSHLTARNEKRRDSGSEAQHHSDKNHASDSHNELHHSISEGSRRDPRISPERRAPHPDLEDSRIDSGSHPCAKSLSKDQEKQPDRVMRPERDQSSTETKKTVDTAPDDKVECNATVESYQPITGTSNVGECSPSKSIKEQALLEQERLAQKAKAEREAEALKRRQQIDSRRHSENTHHRANKSSKLEKGPKKSNRSRSRDRRGGDRRRRSSPVRSSRADPYSRKRSRERSVDRGHFSRRDSRPRRRI